MLYHEWWHALRLFTCMKVDLSAIFSEGITSFIKYQWEMHITILLRRISPCGLGFWGWNTTIIRNLTGALMVGKNLLWLVQLSHQKASTVVIWRHLFHMPFFSVQFIAIMHASGIYYCIESQFCLLQCGLLLIEKKHCFSVIT